MLMNLQVAKNNDDIVLVKLNWDDDIDRMSEKYFDGNEKAVKITKGARHVVTFYYDNGNSGSWEYGLGGYTLVSDRIRGMTHRVTRYLKDENISIA